MNPLSMVKMMGSMMPGNNNSEPELSKEEQKKRNAKYMYKTITKLKAHEVKSLVNAILDSMCIVTSNEQVKDSPHPGDASPTYNGIHSLADELTATIFSKVVDQLNSEESTSKQTGGGGPLDDFGETAAGALGSLTNTAAGASESLGSMATDAGSMATDAISSTPTGLAASAGVAGASVGASALSSLTNTVAGAAGSVANTAANTATKAAAGATDAASTGTDGLGDLTKMGGLGGLTKMGGLDGLTKMSSEPSDNDESSDDEADIEKKVKEANVEKKDDTEVSDGEITEDEVDDDDKESDLKQKTLNHLRKRIIQTIQRGGFESLIKSIRITADNYLNDTDIAKNPKFGDIMKIMAEKDIKLLESHMEFMLYKLEPSKDNIETSKDNKNIDDYISMILVLKHFNKNNSFDIDVDLNQYKLKNDLINQADFDKKKETYIQKAKSNLKKYGLSSYDNIKDDMDKTIDTTKLTELIQESQDKTTGGTRRYKKKGKRLTKRNKSKKH